MIRLIVITLSLAMLAASHAQLISVTVTSDPPAAIVAESIVDGCNAALKDRCDRIKNMWSMLWENERATPAQILAALGTNARKVFQAAALARSDLEAIAALANTTPAALLGDSKYLSPKFAVTFFPDGTAVLTNP